MTVELDLDPSVFLDFLQYLDRPGLIVRGGSIALFRRTDFGPFRPDSESTRFRHDAQSGLSIDPGRIRRICLLAGGSAPPVFEVDLVGHGFALAVLPGNSEADRVATWSFVHTHRATAVAYESVRREGAAAWLDEIGSAACPDWSNRLVFDRDSGTVAVSLSSPALSASARFQPALTDRDGDTLKLSDRRADTVLHFRAGEESPFLSFPPRHSTPLPH